MIATLCVAAILFLIFLIGCYARLRTRIRDGESQERHRKNDDDNNKV